MAVQQETPPVSVAQTTRVCVVLILPVHWVGGGWEWEGLLTAVSEEPGWWGAHLQGALPRPAALGSCCFFLEAIDPQR